MGSKNPVHTLVINPGPIVSGHKHYPNHTAVTHIPGGLVSLVQRWSWCWSVELGIIRESETVLDLHVSQSSHLPLPYVSLYLLEPVIHHASLIQHMPCVIVAFLF